MTFPVDDIYPPPRPRSWGARAGHVGIIWHTTEYAGTSRASALACARDQAARGPNGEWLQPGSYNFIVYDGGVLLTVPYLEASGGINPASTSWAPQPWLKSLLPAPAFAEPTMHHLQVAFSGRAVDGAANRWPSNMIDTAARIGLWMERSAWGADNLVFSGHADWQSNRSDPGAGVIDRIIARMQQLGSPAPTPPPPDYESLYRAELAKVTDLTAKVRAERARVAERDAYIDRYPRT